MILVSSCLIGIDSKYNGSSNKVSIIMRFCKTGLLIPICPEQLGGLATPRLPSEITGGIGTDVLYGTARVISSNGADVTGEYIKGANEVLKYLNLYRISSAVLKEGSPSCGSNFIYDGTFKHKKMPGYGVAAALLKKYNVPVYSEEDITVELMDELIYKDRNQ